LLLARWRISSRKKGLLQAGRDQIKPRSSIDRHLGTAPGSI
jgi:hypothetical protein